MKDDPYRIAARRNAAAREAGQVIDAVPVKFEVKLPHSELYERPRGWRKFFLKVRRVPTANSAMRRIAEQQ